MYAKRFEDLPICLRIGDVIRVHRATLRMWKGIRQFNVSVHFKSSWALYSSEKLTPTGFSPGSAPYAFSGKKTTQEK